MDYFCEKRRITVGDFGEAERKILGFMKSGTQFIFNGKKYEVVFSDKPTCYRGEPKTDIYILAKSSTDKVEIKISYKKENADFIENKMSAERAEQLFGSNWKEVIKYSTSAIEKKFAERILIYKNKLNRTGKGSITLGWKFELMNKNNGELSGKMFLSMNQVLDVYAGNNLSIDKRNARVCGRYILDSGIANYILMDESVRSAQDVINKMIPIYKYVYNHPEIYFACKALNYRTFEKKWDGDRPLAVQVEWYAEKGRLIPKLIFDKPLLVNGNEAAERLLIYMRKLQIKTTDDINNENIGTDRII